jgi:5-methyltetrahydrofolate--homocysteine methyltransferase
MKQAVAYLMPFMEADKAGNDKGQSNSNGKILMATVKGDVHDIGKNIVGVVLQCNGYEVSDLGVMAPCELILETARRENVDAIGLSGLITPSLDEMCFVASEMEREGMTLPLLIGGATTSKAHTAVKLEPAYSGPVVHVDDASRAVGVAAALMDPLVRDRFVAERRAEYAEVRRFHEQHASPDRRVSLAQARASRLVIDWTASAPPRPTFSGVRTLADYPIEELVERIDWTPFFATWELKGRYPAILSDATVGSAARDLFDDAQVMLRRAIDEGLLRADGVVGFWPAGSTTDDDIVIWADDARSTELARLHTLRQQVARKDGRADLALADFVAPISASVPDHIGAFAVTAGHGLQEARAHFEAAHDDYSAILLTALADRLAEAFAERLHERVRRELWGYASDEGLDNAGLIAESYQGIRPAPGYPACPDHTEKGTIFRLLQAESRAGMELTESMAMLPAASVSGLYFWHPQARYFGVGRIDRDQLEDYARRKGWSTLDAERWLAPNLAG